jgi:hypothetical protein
MNFLHLKSWSNNTRIRFSAISLATILYTASLDSYKIKTDGTSTHVQKNEVNTPPPYVRISCFGGSLCYPESPLNDAKPAKTRQAQINVSSIQQKIIPKCYFHTQDYYTTIIKSARATFLSVRSSTYINFGLTC